MILVQKFLHTLFRKYLCGICLVCFTFSINGNSSASSIYSEIQFSSLSSLDSCIVTAVVSENLQICIGSSNGSATITLSNALIPVNWTLNGIPVSGNDTTISFTGLFAGTYTALFTDLSGCIDSQLFAISSPPFPLSIDSCSHTDVTCHGANNGTLAVGTVKDSVGIVTFSWTNSANVVVGNSPNVSNLPPGTYILTLIDNCDTISCTQTIIEPPPLNISNCSGTNVTCNGGGNGSVSAGTISGSIGTINYFWNDSAGNSIGNTPGISGLLAGTYTLTVTDNCSSVSCSYTVTQPGILSMT